MLIVPNCGAYSSIKSLSECNTGTTQNLPFGVNTTIELKHITNTADNTGTLVSSNIPRWMPLLSNVVVIYLSSIVVLNANGQYLDSSLLHSVSESMVSYDYEALLTWQLPNTFPTSRHRSYVYWRVVSEVAFIPILVWMLVEVNSLFILLITAYTIPWYRCLLTLVYILPISRGLSTFRCSLICAHVSFCI